LQKEYWNNRYHKGSSGLGSVGAYRAWKWSLINKYVDAQDVIDVGCGDLRFWEGRICGKYVGIDLSDFIIQKDKKLRPEWRFICANAADLIQGLNAKVVLCVALLFHVMDDKEYLKILENLCRYSREWMFVNAWIKNPLHSTKSHQIFRRLKTDVFSRHGFELVAAEVCFDHVNGMYVLRKTGK